MAHRACSPDTRVGVLTAAYGTAVTALFAVGIATNPYARPVWLVMIVLPVFVAFLGVLVVLPCPDCPHPAKESRDGR